MSRKICTIGLGYVGLPTASLLGTLGFEVIGVDVNPEIVDTINRGQIHFTEPGLDALVRSAVQSGYLKAAREPTSADVFIIAVPTPFDSDNRPDLGHVKAATESLVPVLRPGNLVILESTSPVGTTRDVVAGTLQAAGFKVGSDIYVAHCPERVLPGRILTELVELDRVVGGINEESTDAAVDFFSSFVSGEVLGTSAETAEMTKLVENSYRDVNIAFANELSLICDAEGISVGELVSLANRHPRVNILNPGPGVGGHCIAVDPWFLIAKQPGLTRLISTARSVNSEKPRWVVERVKKHARKFVSPVISCLGLTYKADVDDLRESPALAIARQLRDDAVGELLVAEPNISRTNEFNLVDVSTAISNADIVVILVGHRQFRTLNADRFNEKVVIDTVGMLR